MGVEFTEIHLERFEHLHNPETCRTYDKSTARNRAASTRRRAVRTSENDQYNDL